MKVSLTRESSHSPCQMFCEHWSILGVSVTRSLSITHKFCYPSCPMETKVNIVKLGYTAPHDVVTWRRVASAVEVAAEPGDFYDVIGDGWLSMGSPPAGFDPMPFRNSV